MRQKLLRRPGGETGGKASTDEAVDLRASVNSATNAFASTARMRIYFHTPPSPDDAHPILPAQTDSRKGKRKKLDEEDDAEEGLRAAPHPPASDRNESVDGDSTIAPSASHMEFDANAGRGSVAPSVAETASEADWLMAAIVDDGEADGEGENEEETQTVGDDIGAHEHDGKLGTSLK